MRKLLLGAEIQQNSCNPVEIVDSVHCLRGTVWEQSLPCSKGSWPCLGSGILQGCTSPACWGIYSQNIWKNLRSGREFPVVKAPGRAGARPGGRAPHPNGNGGHFMGISWQKSSVIYLFISFPVQSSLKTNLGKSREFSSKNVRVIFFCFLKTKCGYSPMDFLKDT